MYCVVKEDKVYTGTKSEIVHQMCSFRVDENRILYYTIHGYKEVKLHSYNKEFSVQEIEKNVIDVLFRILIKKYEGYRKIT